MLGSNYITINGTGYTPTAFSYTIEAIETVNQSEGGTDLVTAVRLNKHIFTASWEGIDSTTLDALEAICTAATATLVYRSSTYTVRARGASPELLTKSYKYSRSDGLWNISITFTEI